MHRVAGEDAKRYTNAAGEDVGRIPKPSSDLGPGLRRGDGKNGVTAGI